MVVGLGTRLEFSPATDKKIPKKSVTKNIVKSLFIFYPLTVNYLYFRRITNCYRYINNFTHFYKQISCKKSLFVVFYKLNAVNSGG